MPRKKSVKHAAQAFIAEVDSLLAFCKDAKSAGAWVKRQGRFEKIADSFKKLAREIEAEAPY